MKTIAIIGAGAAGCVAAKNLAKLGYAAQVFDKSRGVGGRMATRRSSAGEFDHGARCFTAKTAEFSKALSQAPVKLWPEAEKQNQAHCFVATPRQNQLTKFWLDTTPAQLNCKIDQLQQNSDGWRLVSDQQQTFGPFKGVVLAIPAPQACDLLANSELAIPEALTSVSMDPVWALMFSLETPLGEATYSDPGPSLSWLGANFTKPDRPQTTDSYAYVAHASRQWSSENLEDEAADVAEALLQNLADYIADFPTPHFASAHRWRFALTHTPLGRSHLALDNHLILAGDWCLGAEVEDAFRSGTEAALQMHRDLTSSG
jgi:renalase